MKRIMLIGFFSFFGLISNSMSASTTIVSGNGSASCPAGYSLTGIVPVSQTGMSNQSNPSIFNCSSVSTTSVSGCKIGYKTGRNQSYRSDSVSIKIICAKSCGN